MYPKTLKTLLIVLFLIGCSIVSFANDRYKVNTERLNVRSTIGASSKPFGYFQYGDTVNVIDKTNSYWYKIKIQDKEGYVRSKYLSPIKDVTTSENPNVDYILILGVVFVAFSIIVCVVAAFTNGNKQIYNEDNLSPGTTIIVKHKSVGVALLLTFFFGPFGMIYSTVKGALIMIFLPIILIIILVSLASTNSTMFNLALAGSILYAIFYWLICIIWAAVAASNSNKIIIHQSPLSNNNEN